ncbi:MAG: NAD(P)-dependent oxidoreductase [Ectothiorhodospiraceae bacterium]|nr:NAD(P)-dependent oxidoreductase [Ectothiorhodospiraceae bacterium]
MNNITLLGSGAMGSRMALKLIEAGYQVAVYNRTPENAQRVIKAGARYFDSPHEAVKQADIVISMLNNDVASKATWLNTDNGAIYGMKENAIAIESSTLSVAWLTQLANEMTAQNIAFIDAPVVGSRPQAEAGALVFLAGGKPSTLDTVRPMLALLSSSIIHVGPSGSGIKMKLAVNAFFGMQVIALSESIGLLEKCGIEKSTAIDVFNQLPTTSPALQGIGGLIAAENYAPLFPIDLVEKDFRYALAMAENTADQYTLTQTAHSTFKTAISAGYGSDNIASVARLFDD